MKKPSPNSEERSHYKGYTVQFDPFGVIRRDLLYIICIILLLGALWWSLSNDAELVQKVEAQCQDTINKITYNNNNKDIVGVGLPIYNMNEDNN
jgi:hypothetical protein